MHASIFAHSHLPCLHTHACTLLTLTHGLVLTLACTQAHLHTHTCMLLTVMHGLVLTLACTQAHLHTQHSHTAHTHGLILTLACTQACLHTHSHAAHTHARSPICMHTHTHCCQAGHPAPHGNSRLSFFLMAFCVIRDDSPASPCACASQPEQREGG